MKRRVRFRSFVVPFFVLVLFEIVAVRVVVPAVLASGGSSGTVVASSVSYVQGRQLSGSYQNTWHKDGVYHGSVGQHIPYCGNQPQGSGNSSSDPLTGGCYSLTVDYVFNTTASLQNINSLYVGTFSHMCTTTSSYTFEVDMYNYYSSSWDQVGLSTYTSSDIWLNKSMTPVSNYVSNGIMKLQWSAYGTCASLYLDYMGIQLSSQQAYIVTLMANYTDTANGTSLIDPYFNTYVYYHSNKTQVGGLIADGGSLSVTTALYGSSYDFVAWDPSFGTYGVLSNINVNATLTLTIPMSTPSFSIGTMKSGAYVKEPLFQMRILTSDVNKAMGGCGSVSCSAFNLTYTTYAYQQALANRTSFLAKLYNGGTPIGQSTIAYWPTVALEEYFILSNTTNSLGFQNRLIDYQVYELSSPSPQNPSNEYFYSNLSTASNKTSRYYMQITADPLKVSFNGSQFFMPAQSYSYYTLPELALYRDSQISNSTDPVLNSGMLSYLYNHQNSNIFGASIVAYGYDRVQDYVLDAPFAALMNSRSNMTVTSPSQLLGSGNLAHSYNSYYGSAHGNITRTGSSTSANVVIPISGSFTYPYPDINTTAYYTISSVWNSTRDSTSGYAAGILSKYFVDHAGNPGNPTYNWKNEPWVLTNIAVSEALNLDYYMNKTAPTQWSFTVSRLLGDGGTWAYSVLYNTMPPPTYLSNAIIYQSLFSRLLNWTEEVSVNPAFMKSLNGNANWNWSSWYCSVVSHSLVGSGIYLTNYKPYLYNQVVENYVQGLNSGILSASSNFISISRSPLTFSNVQNSDGTWNATYTSLYTDINGNQVNITSILRILSGASGGLIGLDYRVYNGTTLSQYFTSRYQGSGSTDWIFWSMDKTGALKAPIDSAKNWGDQSKLTGSLSVTVHEPTGAVNTYSISLSTYASYFGMSTSFSRYSGGVILSISFGVEYYDLARTATPSPNPETQTSAISSVIEFEGGAAYAWCTPLISLLTDLTVGIVKTISTSILVGLQGGLSVGAFTYTVLHDGLGLDPAIAAIIAIPAGVIGALIFGVGAAVVYGLVLLLTIILRDLLGLI